MHELLACLAVLVVIFLVCRRIISCCRHNNDEYGHRHPILVSSSRNVSYTQGFYAPVKSTPTIPSFVNRCGYSRPFQASTSQNKGSQVKEAQTSLRSDGWYDVGVENIPDTRDLYVPTKSTVKTGRNLPSTRRIPPPREGPSSITVLSNVLLSDEGEYFTAEEDLREKARRMKREGQEARNRAKQARKRRDFSAEAMHKQNARACECAMERLNKEAATAIFNQKNKSLSNGTIDLHGLYVNEALKYAELGFQSVVLRNDKVVRFIVGKGLHARDGKAKIRPAVEKLCKKRGFTYHLDPNNAGILVVQC